MHIDLSVDVGGRSAVYATVERSVRDLTPAFTPAVTIAEANRYQSSPSSLRVSAPALSLYSLLFICFLNTNRQKRVIPINHVLDGSAERSMLGGDMMPVWPVFLCLPSSSVGYWQYVFGLSVCACVRSRAEALSEPACRRLLVSFFPYDAAPYGFRGVMRP